MACDDVFFNDTWRAYVHHPNVTDWTHASYKSVGVLSGVDDFWLLWNACEPVITRTMMFVMRENVFPTWDDAACIDGAIGSALVPETRAPEVFREMVGMALGEWLARCPGRWSEVNGVSIAPKKEFCVVKLWTTSTENKSGDFHWPTGIDGSKVRFQPCRTHIASIRHK